jgi:hypothetical protein
MLATFGLRRRVLARARRFALLFARRAKGGEGMLPDGGGIGYYLVSLCLPAILIALVVAALYIKERNKKL